MSPPFDETGTYYPGSTRSRTWDDGTELPIAERPAWHADAACRGAGAHLFYSERGWQSSGNVEDAQALCAVCPVTADCLSWALDHNERFGVWGGTTVNERRALRRENRRVVS